MGDDYDRIVRHTDHGATLLGSYMTRIQPQYTPLRERLADWERYWWRVTVGVSALVVVALVVT